MEKTIRTIRKSQRAEIRVSLTEYHGHDLCDVRVFAEPYSGDEWIATKKGLSLSVELLPELIAALQQAEAEARAASLLKNPDADSAAPTEATETAPAAADGGDLTIVGAG